MTGRNDRSHAGERADDVVACDALLDRLGRREPGHTDLDDVVAASLALLAGDVDLRPVPVEATLEALAGVGAWPLPDRWTGPVRDGVLPASPQPGAGDPTIVAPRTPSDGTVRSLSNGRRSDCRSGRRSDPTGQGAVPRVFRIGSSAGLAAAASLVVIAGFSALLTAQGTANPLGGIASVVSWWGGTPSSTVSRHDELAAKLKVAQVLLDRGHTTEAARIIDDVRTRVRDLPPAEQADLLVGIAEIDPARSTPTDVPVGSVGSAGSADDGSDHPDDTSTGDPVGTVPVRDPAAGSASTPAATRRRTRASHQVGPTEPVRTSTSSAAPSTTTSPPTITSTSDRSALSPPAVRVPRNRGASGGKGKTKGKTGPKTEGAGSGDRAASVDVTSSSAAVTSSSVAVTSSSVDVTSATGSARRADRRRAAVRAAEGARGLGLASGETSPRAAPSPSTERRSPP